MREAFKPGTTVRWNIPDGARCTIVCYLKEGFYLIRTIPEGREMIGRGSDLLLPEKWEQKYLAARREET